MADFEKLSASDQLRNSESVFLPDARSGSTSIMRPDGAFAQVNLADRHDLINHFVLVDAVPLDVRVHFETAKNLYLYAWFVYRFFPVAEKHVLATLEFALREKLTYLYPEEFGLTAKRHPTLRALFARARKERLITNEGQRSTEIFALQHARERVSMERMRELQVSGLSQIEYDESAIQTQPEDYVHDWLGIFEEALPGIRNTYAHGSAMLHSSVLRTFEIVTDLVNELYREQGT